MQPSAESSIDLPGIKRPRSGKVREIFDLILMDNGSVKMLDERARKISPNLNYVYLSPSQVELSFRPFVLWSWLRQLLFAASGALLLLRSALLMGGRQRGVTLSRLTVRSRRPRTES